MKHIYILTISLLIFLSFLEKSFAQTPSDAIMMTQRETCVAIIYEHRLFNKYWEGTLLRTNETIATVKRNTGIPMIAIGVLDKLNLIIAMPYVQTYSTKPNGGKFAGANGFQDVNLALKGEIFTKETEAGKLAVLATVGFSTPVTDYLSDYRPYSIGFGAPQLSFRGILEYKLKNGVFARGTLAYLWRGQTKAERDYYYNNGSYYTPWMDVPSAWNYQVVAGIWMLENTLRIETSYTSLISTSGDDIRPYNAPQPTNKVIFGQLGLSVQHYLSKPKGIGWLIYGNQILHGRNVGKASQFGIGLTYQFKI